MCHQKLFMLMTICVMICGIFLPVFSFLQSMPKKQSSLKTTEIRTVILKPCFERASWKSGWNLRRFRNYFWCGVFIYEHCKDESRSSKKIFDFVKKFMLIFRNLQAERISWPFLIIFYKFFDPGSQNCYIKAWYYAWRA